MNRQSPIEVVDSKALGMKAAEPKKAEFKSGLGMAPPAPLAFALQASGPKASQPKSAGGMPPPALSAVMFEASEPTEQFAIVPWGAAVVQQAATPKLAAPPQSGSPPKAADPEQASSAAPSSSQARIPVLGGAAMAAAPKSHNSKIPQKPEKFFKKVVLPKLEKGNPVDIAGYLAEWAPQRLKVIRSAMRDPTYEAMRVEAKSVMTSYDDSTIQCSAEHRPAEGIRIMMKVRAFNGKLSQAGSHVFPIKENCCCSKNAYLYLDMLRLVTMVCEREKADLARTKAWHSEVKTYIEFMLAED